MAKADKKVALTALVRTNLLDKLAARGIKECNGTSVYELNNKELSRFLAIQQYRERNMDSPENKWFRGGGKMINKLVNEAFETAISKGWHDQPIETGTCLALIHSEVSEALEADRRGDEENFAEELADVCIRVFDLCGAKDIDLEAAILKKMAYNKNRPVKHGGKAY